jgi:WD40 repeat protein
MSRSTLGLVLLVLSLPGTAWGQQFRAAFHYVSDDFTALTFTPDGRRVLAAQMNGALSITDAATGKELMRVEAHSGGVLALALSPDGRTLATGGADRQLLLWDPQTCEGLRPLAGNHDQVSAVAFSPDGRTLASGDHAGRIILWEVKSGRELKRWQTFAERVTALAFTPDGKSLLSGGTWPEETVTRNVLANADRIRLWDIHTGKEQARLPVRGAGLSLAARGRLLAAGSYQVALEQTATELLSAEVQLCVSVFDRSARRELFRLEQAGGALALSPDGRLLVTGRGSERSFSGLTNSTLFFPRNAPRGLTLWEVHSGRAIRTVELPGVSSALAVSPDGTRVAVGVSGSYRDSRFGPRRRGGWDGWGDRDGFAPTPPRVSLIDLKPEGWSPEKAGVPGPRQLEQAWADLASEEPAVAYRAVWALGAAGNDAVRLLAQRLAPVRLDPARLRKLVNDLDARRYAVRAAAFRELESMGADAGEELRRFRPESLSPEARRRVEVLLRAVEHRNLRAEVVRPLRAVAVLERIRSPEARGLLERLAAGSPEAELTREAREALARPAR